jgi:uncharacterized protein YicC (UPF0701 family)/vacuolar-type H+-ATPase subunit E/Vma4
VVSLENLKMIGVAIDTVREINKNGFTMENVTQLALTGMSLAGVDQNTVDFVKKLPERIKDAEALLSGDFNRILERGELAGLPVQTIKKFAEDGFTFETANQLVIDGMTMAGVDQKAIDVVKQLPARIEDAQALLSGDPNRIVERGILAGLPLHTVKQIVENGFSADNITQLIADGMTFQGVDQNTIDLVRQLPERFKDAEALISGDIDKILERGKLAGLPLNAIQQIATNGFSAETAAQLAVDGMTMAGVDQKAIDVVKQLPARFQDAQALLSGDPNRIVERGILAGLPLHTVQQIVENGFSADNITQLIADGMTFQGVDQKTIDLVKQLPERFKDAEALISGDIDKILERGKLAGLPLNAIQQIATKGFSAETAAQLAVDGMTMAGVDQKAIDSVRTLCERVQNIQALANGNIEQILEYAKSTGLSLDLVTQIAKNGFSAESATKLLLEGMALAGVDSKKVDFMKKMSEQIKDAQVLSTGNIDEICRRRILDGIPANTVREIFSSGLSIEAATQFALDRMSTADVDPKAIELLCQLPERMKDAKALFSGNVNEMLERGMSAGLPLNAIQQIATNDFSAETATKLLLEGMTLAGVDSKKIDFVKKMSEQIKDAKVLSTGNIDEICRQYILYGIPENTVREIFSSGLSIEAATQFALDRMSTADVDQKAIELLRQLPERMKDAKALFSGNVNEILERGMSAGLPLNAIQQIVTNGFSPESAIQLALKGMSLAGVDPTTVDLVKKLPEEIQDAQALLSGNINEICERSTFADVSINAIRQIAMQKNSIDAIIGIAVNGMAVAGVDESTLDFVKKMPEKVDGMKSVLISIVENIFDKKMPSSVDQLFRMCNEQSLFNGEEEKIFEMICRRMSLTQDVFDGDDETVLLKVCKMLNEKVNSLPLGHMAFMVLSNARKRVAEREEKNIQDLLNSTKDQLKSMSSTFDNQTRKVINQILQSENRWDIFERTKDQLDDRLRRLLGPVIEREKQLVNDTIYLNNDSDRIIECFEQFDMTFEEGRKQASSLRKAIEKYVESDNALLKQVMIEIVKEITAQTNQTRNPKLMTLLKEYFNENIIQPIVEMACERLLDQYDTDLVNKFTGGITYVRNQQKQTRR